MSRSIQWELVASSMILLCVLLGSVALQYPDASPGAPQSPAPDRVSFDAFSSALPLFPIDNASHRLAAASGTTLFNKTPRSESEAVITHTSVDAPAENISGNTTEPAKPLYDDEKLAEMIACAGVPLMVTSVQYMYSLYYWDEAAVRNDALAMYDLASEELRKARALNVSPEREEIRSGFVGSLEKFQSAGAALKGKKYLNATEVDQAIGDLTQGSGMLKSAMEALGTVLEEYEQSPQIADNISQYTLSSGRTVSPNTFVGALSMLERYSYDDRYGENTLSLIIESSRKIGSYSLVGNTREIVDADSGRRFLIVVVKSTHTGHKSDGKRYTVTTPDPKAFKLIYYDTQYSPMSVPATTSVGTSYRLTTLNRYESVKGYLFFDVPATLEVTDAYLQADLGTAGKPVWSLRNIL